LLGGFGRLGAMPFGRSLFGGDPLIGALERRSASLAAASRSRVGGLTAA
jgi:hypothetical protein